MGKTKEGLGQDKNLHRWLFGIGSVLWIALFLVGIFFHQVWYRKARISFLDIGQGDSTLIRTTNGATILVDGGKNGRLLLERLSSKLGYFDRSIEMLVITHPDSDHFGGLLEVLRYYKVKSVLLTGIKDTGNASYQELLQLLNTQFPQPKIIPATQGEEVYMDGVRLTILYPQDLFWGQEVQDNNETSIVILANIGGQGYLLTGDASKEIEEKLISQYPKLKVDVLKVGHHGSKTSTSARLLEMWHPTSAVISAGENNQFGHPHQDVLHLLNQYGVKILVTFLDKNIDF